MTTAGIIAYRLLNQHIAAPGLKKPEDVVRHMIAIQSQEYATAKWSVGLRMMKGTDAVVEKAINDGHILRTHLMRPTWHFVAPQDIRWLLQLTAPRVHAVNAFMYRKCELDEKVFSKCNNIIVKALQADTYATRTTLKGLMEQARIITDTVRLSCIMMYAELEGIICSGPKQGKQYTYALLEERVPPVKPLTKQEALAELANRYFASRGPATIKDLVWWSGLTMKEAKESVGMLGKRFERGEVDGQEYIFIPGPHQLKASHISTFLMPDFDEYGLSYKDRSAIEGLGNTLPKGRAYSRVVIVDGTIAGSWKPVTKGKAVSVETTPFSKFSKATNEKVAQATRRYLSFVGM